MKKLYTMLLLFCSLVFLLVFNVTILFILVAVKCHICMLKKRPDPSLKGVLRWSLSYDEICYCQGVVAPRLSKTCSKEEELVCSDSTSCRLWLVEDPALFTQRRYWNKKALAQLLERADYCGKFTTSL